MYEEERSKLIERIAQLSEENNRLLKKLVRAQNWATVWSVLKWTIVILLTLWGYYYLQPYLDQMLKLYQQLSPTVSSLQNLNNLLPKP